MRAIHENGERHSSDDPRHTPARKLGPPGQAGSHSVQFYEDQTAFIQKLAEFVGAALGTGGSSIVIASKEHRSALADKLAQWGVDLDRISASGRYLALDAEECLAQFMIEGWPDRDRFFGLIEPELNRATNCSIRESASVAAFGEMVALLWERGQHEGALHLEHLWNELVERYSINLLCAYPLACFANESQYDLFSRVCREHMQVLPAETYNELASEEDRKRMITSLQQKAAVVRTVVEERERAIAQRMHAEDKLWRSEEFARTVVEGGVDCVMVLDLAGNLEYISPSGLAALEIGDIRSVLGHSWLEFWREEDRLRAREAHAAARSGGVGSFQGDCVTAKGDRQYWDVRITAANGRDGRVERLIAVSRDLTQLRQAQQIAVQAEKLAAAGRMAATIAHEINNPLEAVTNFIYLARTAPGMPAESASHLEIADRELARVAQIAQKTLGFYRDTSKIKSISVSELVNEVMMIYERKLRYKQLVARVYVDPNLKLRAKLGELKQVLSNLLANAIDASKEGGTIWVRAHASLDRIKDAGPGIRFTIADNGSGMSADVQRRIFVPFFTTKANIGTGIGLWVTRSLIEQQGGYLRFRSSQGQHSGTVMSFFVPISVNQQANELPVAA